MKTTMRIGTFETNSSGTHCFCWMNDYDIEAFFNGEFYISADEDWEEGREIGEKEYQQRLQEYKDHHYQLIEDYKQRGHSPWFMDQTEEDLETLFPLYDDVITGAGFEETEPYGDEYKRWHKNIQLSDNDYSEGWVSMRIAEPPETDSPDEKKKVEFENYPD